MFTIEVKVNGNPVAVINGHRCANNPGETRYRYAFSGVVWSGNNGAALDLHGDVLHAYSDGILKLAEKVLAAAYEQT